MQFVVPSGTVGIIYDPHSFVNHFLKKVFFLFSGLHLWLKD